MEVLGKGFKRTKEKGVTLLESIVATVIVSIGFIAIFQMVNYAVISIDTSSERTKANYLVSMVAEDLIGDKNSIVAGNVTFKEHLVDETDSEGNAWKMANCSTGSTSSGTHQNAYDNKTKRKWNNRFSKKRLKCKSDKDTKILKVFDICSSLVAAKANPAKCKFKNKESWFLINTGNEVMVIGKMEVRLNNARKKKYLYFQID